MTLQEQFEIIQAAIDGKEIEFYSSIKDSWMKKDVLNNPIFDFKCTKYRIKPKPKKEIKLHQYLVKNLTTNQYISITGYYPDIDSCRKNMNMSDTYWQGIEKLQYTEITVTED